MSAFISLPKPENADKRYALQIGRSIACRLLELLPPAWREALAETLLRRHASPGPAAEHVFQYRLSLAQKQNRDGRLREAVIAKGADLFYARQYRQFLNPAMAAFALTATHVLAVAGGEARGFGWRRRRKVHAAMLESVGEAMPILALSDQAVAVPLFLPKAKRAGEFRVSMRWLAGAGAMPDYYRGFADGEPVNCKTPGAEAREIGHDGAVLLMTDAAVRTRRLALLALHPCDADAMGLHITLFGVQALTPEQLQSDYGLDDKVVAAYRSVAARTGRMLVFLAGGSEETFTQCSQNLFVKRPVQAATSGRSGYRWWPDRPVEQLLEKQFESLQATVAAYGLPGVSPRNGDMGKAVFVAYRSGRAYLLVPYHPGNAVHGHAAKLWSNPYGSLTIHDDHTYLTSVTFSGHCRTVPHRRVQKLFPDIADTVMSQTGRNGKSIGEPEYWFLQRVDEIVQQREPLMPHQLSPLRASCGIAAGGQALYNKKPGYFGAESLPAYDQVLQHRREAAGRPLDTSGEVHADWQTAVGGALRERRAHLLAQQLVQEITVSLPANSVE